MKKRLLIVFSIFIAAVVLILLGSAVFRLESAEISLYGENGEEIVDTSGLDPAELIADFAGKSILFLPESSLADNIHSKTQFSAWQVVGVEKYFPNKIRIHLTRRLQVFTLIKDGARYAVDVNGYVISLIEGVPAGCVDISSFAPALNDVKIASKLSFKTQEAEADFELIKIMTNTVWRLNYDFEEIYKLIGVYKLEGGELTLFTQTGAKIVIKDAGENLETKLSRAYGVYSDPEKDMTGENIVITVYSDGRIISSK